MLPVDGSETCTHAYSTTRELAEKYNSEILLLNVQTLHYQWAYAPMAINNQREKYEEISDEIIKKALDYFKDYEIKVSAKTTIGDPASNIIDTAKEENCDLIVMCTHGMSATKRFTIGSVTNKVVHHAETPVLVLR